MNKRTKIGFIAGLVALVLVVAVVLLVIFWPTGSGDDTIVPLEFNNLESTVDESGIRTVSVPVNEEGEAAENLSGALVEMLPADLTKIKIENE